MPRLLGTEEWNKAAINRTVSYLLNCAAEAAALSDTFGSTQIQDDRSTRQEGTALFEVRNARMELVTEALALLLVSDNLNDAIRFLADPGWILNGHAMKDNPEGFGTLSTNIRQFVRISLFVTLAGEGQMRATMEELAFSTERGYLGVQWRREAEREFVSVLPVLYAIAVASRSERETIDFLGSQITAAVRNATHIDLMEEPDFQLLGIYATPPLAQPKEVSRQTVFNWIDGLAALWEMERRYAMRVRQMRQDTYHWNAINPTGDLVDWSLLIAEVAALRSGRSPVPLNIEVLPEMRFCQELASAFAQHAPRK